MREQAENETDVVKLLMDLSYLSAMLAVDIEEDRAAGMERLFLEYEQLEDLMGEIDEQIFTHYFHPRIACKAKVSQRVLLEMLDVRHVYRSTPKTRRSKTRN